MFRKILIIGTVAAALICTPASATPASATLASAIANGEDAPDGAYPFAVQLTMTGLPTADHGTRNSSCSGALIAARWVITAGHCFRTDDDRRVSHLVAKRTMAIIGRTDLNKDDGHEVEVVAVRQSKVTDVAMAKLSTPVTDITPLKLATEPPAVGDILRLAGYGLTDNDESAKARRLQTGQFVVDSVQDTLLATSGHAPQADTSPCPHDSGGPYFRQPKKGPPVLVAVVSTGPGCPGPGPDFSARTDILTDWITATMDGETNGILDRLDDARFLGIGSTTLVALLAILVPLQLARRRRATTLATPGGPHPDPHGKRHNSPDALAQ